MCRTDCRRERQAPRDNVRVQVAEQQRRLKKHEARGPDRGGASEPREDQFGEQRLEQEEQERAEENRERE